MYNVLVFPAGEMNAAEIHASLAHQVNVRVFGASSVERLGHHLFARYSNDLPLINDPTFLEAFNALLKEWEIDVIIPTHDSVVTYLVDVSEQLSAKLLAPDRETANACRDKRLCYELFLDQPFTPVTYGPQAPLDFPVFVKPAKGQGSVGARLVTNANDAKTIEWDQEVVCEYLPGEEVTVDCFTDQHGALQVAFARVRERTLGGISVAGRRLKEVPEIQRMAETINDRLAFLGMWYFQAKRSVSGDWKLLEISARGAGSQCLTRAAGINLPLLSVYAAIGREVGIQRQGYDVRVDRLLANRYDVDFEYEVVYIDFDDTITSGDGVNADIMRLLYQWRNDGKTIHLITRHAHKLDETLKSLCIASSLFARIIHIRDGKPKADFIDPNGAIFIDNAFSERQAVFDQHKIPVLDVETTEILQHWKS